MAKKVRHPFRRCGADRYIMRSSFLGVFANLGRGLGSTITINKHLSIHPSIHKRLPTYLTTILPTRNDVPIPVVELLTPRSLMAVDIRRAALIDDILNIRSERIAWQSNRRVVIVA